MKRVAIFGVGLIGGSFALALRKAGFDGEIVGVSSPRTIETALAMGVIDRAADSTQAVSECDLLYLSQPILTIIKTLGEIGPKIRPETLVTDAGSTKRQIVETAYGVIQQGMFLGGHPMAGKERSGVLEADANLFQGRTYVLTPRAPEDVDRPEFEEFRSWILRIGARPVILDADRHDCLVAFTSHLPQLLSTALASVLADIDDAASVAGPGVLDLTRLAMSPYNIWHDIFETNGPHVQEALSLLVARLKDIQDQVSAGGLDVEFERASTAAKRLRDIPYER